MANEYIATDALFVGNARAHNPGDSVPEENIKPNGWQDSVAKVGTKAAEKAVAATAPDAEPLPASAQTPAPK